MKSSPSAAKVAARIRSLALTGTRYGIAARIRPDYVDKLAARLTFVLMRDFDDERLISELGYMASQHAELFRSHNEVHKELRAEWAAKMRPEKTRVDANSLSKLSAEQLLHFANAGELPPNYSD